GSSSATTPTCTRPTTRWRGAARSWPWPGSSRAAPRASACWPGTPTTWLAAMPDARTPAWSAACAACASSSASTSTSPASTMAFLDYRLRAPDRLDELLRRAIRGAQRAPEDVLRMPVAPGALMDEAQLRPPRRKPKPIPRSANTVQRPTPEQLARLALLRRMKRARLVTAEDMARYVGRHLTAEGRIDSAMLQIRSIEDLRAYQTLLTLAQRSRRSGGLRRDDPLGRLLRGFRVELADAGDGRADNGYLRAPRFTLHRLAPPHRDTA